MRISDWSSDVCSSDLSRVMADLTAEDAARETAALWCIRLSENDMSTAEWSEFDGWLAQPGNADLLQQAASIWEATGEVGNWPNMIALRAQALNDVAKATRRRCWLTVDRKSTRLNYSH